MKVILSLSALLVALNVSATESRIIEGEVIPRESRPEVVQIKINGARCSAVVVGPRAVLTAAHCGTHDAAVEIDVLGKIYLGTFVRSAVYPSVDHDLGVIVTKEVIRDAEPVSILTGVSKGEAVMMFGYGCHQQGGAGGVDFQLRMGKAIVADYQNNELITKGSALCFGDSGGPLYSNVGGNYVLRGIGSKGNIKETSYWTELSSKETHDLFDRVYETYDAKICGFNAECEALPAKPLQPSPVPIVFKKEVFKFTAKNANDIRIDLKELLTDLKSNERTWFLEPDAPEFLEINQEREVLHGYSMGRGTFRFAVGVRSQTSVDAALLELTLTEE